MSDTSSYRPQAAPHFDPFGVMDKFANMQNAINQNQLFQQQNSARQALGPIYQHAIDPATGQFDFDKFFTGVATNPATAFMAGDVLNQGIQRKLTDAQTAVQKLDVAQKSYEHIGAVAGSLVKPGVGGQDTASYDELLKSTGNAVALGYIPKDQALSFLSSAPQDPVKLGAMLKQISLASMGASESAKRVYGEIQMVNQGNQITPMAVSPTQGTARSLTGGGAGTGNPGGTGIPINPTPAEMNAPTSQQTPGGGEVTGPRVGVMPMVGGTGQQIPGSGQGQGTIVTKQPQQVQEYLSGKGAIAEYEKDLNERAANARDALQTYQEQLKLVFNPDGTTKAGLGAGQGMYNILAQVAQAVGLPTSVVDGLQNGNLAAAQQFEKLALGNSIRGLRQLLQGEGRLAVAEFVQNLEKGTPNIHMDPRAIQGMTAFMSRLQDQVIAEQEGFNEFIQTGQQNGWKDGTPNAWPALWNRVIKKTGVLDQPNFFKSPSQGQGTGSSQPNPPGR